MTGFGPVIGRRGSGLVDQALFDVWTLIHIGSATLLWWLGIEPNVALALIVGFEIIENSGIGYAVFNWLGNNKLIGSIPIIGWLLSSQSEYTGDSYGNLLSDIIVGSSVYLLLYYYA